MRQTRCALLFVLVLFGMGTLPQQGAHMHAQSAGGCQSFAQTGHTLCGQFLAYWQSHGGLAQQGYPLSEEGAEISDLNGKSYVVQVFERGVFEKHPENAPPADVLLAQLGRLRYKAKYGGGGAPGQVVNQAGGHYFPETGHTVGGRFWAYWQNHGGVAQQGYPISEEFHENSDLDGKPYLVQYFERAVFEYHPENAAPYDVLLTQLGRLRANVRPAPAPQAPQAGGAPPAPPATSTPVAAAPATRASTFQKGANFTAWWYTQYSGAGADQALAQLAATGANALTLVVTGYQDGLGATQITFGQPRTPSDADLLHVIARAHSLGMTVMLKPHVDLADASHWRGEIGARFSGEAAWQAWFASYQNFINHYAAVAQQGGADYLCIGTELMGTTTREAQWRTVVAGVRAQYKGPLTYAANWGGEETGIRWWDALDYIGVDAYYPLTGKRDPSVEELKQAWVNRGYVNLLEGLSRTFGKPIMFTEIGYGSVSGANMAPATTDSGSLDMQEQANAYEAALATFWGKPWMAGIYWWDWSVDPNKGGSGDSSYTPHNKPAEAVLKSYYTGR
ncbi:MAG TPA: hypothetical protein VM536_11295 [Chloroflexia bacterium]|nr:hypothetical protein [Chloroflexia bacterium]